MGKIIAVAGNLGAGKTTLTRLICEKGSIKPYWERPEERPFQADFTRDPRRWALPNQMDFLLFRCEQEAIARQRDEIAVFDGGFDQDYHVFTRHIYHKGYLSPEEFDLCKRYYLLVRDLLPWPDLIIRIMVDMPTLMRRRSTRGRETVDQSFDPQEFTEIEELLDEWLCGETQSPVIRFPFDQDLHENQEEIDELVIQIKKSL